MNIKSNFQVVAFIILLVTVQSAYAQLDIGTGTGWGKLSPGEPLILNEKFQGFTFFHTDANSNLGNSDNKVDAQGNVIYGYKDDTIAVPVIGSSKGKIHYYYHQCAFAPNWKTAYAYRDSLSTGTGSNTPDVSDGFVEISRKYAASGEFAPTVHGDFIVDLREIEFVEIIQWSHSSTGGNKRGVMCEISLDNGITWDTLRYQPGTAYSSSFTKDMTTGVKTSNGIRCDPSAFGMTWEDGIYTGNVMLRFGEAGGQTPRIHDLKVYGTYNPVTFSGSPAIDGLEIYAAGKKIVLSKPSEIAVYNLSGILVLRGSRTNFVSAGHLPDGIYIVHARCGDLFKTEKVIIK